MKSIKADLFSDLKRLYGEEQGRKTYAQVVQKIETFHKSGRRARPLDEGDVFLITYGDQFHAGKGSREAPLATLLEFCSQRLKACVNTLHILPFFPYSSDDGFAVLDYHAVDPKLGDWEDVQRIGREFAMMFDLVINHISAGSSWFKAFLAGEEPYVDFFINPPAGADLRSVIRPRTTPLLMPVATRLGERQVWTTFSPDQVDLNFRNPEVLLAVLDVILDYAARGASYLRLDAVAFLWKEYDSECLNLPETHLLIQVMRRFLNLTEPHIRLITETNIPHLQNISYFGDGRNEAQLVYNFALPPLVLYALLTGSVDDLREWASALTAPSDETSFFNFLASHDGIGLNPARGILTEDKISRLVSMVKEHGGLVSYKSMPDGSSIPYELNINYFDAVSDPRAGEPIDLQARRFLVSQAVLLALKGVPGIYAHSLLGSRSWWEGPQKTGLNRSINREKFHFEALSRELDDPGTLRHAVFARYEKMLKVRRSNPAFSPHADQTVLSTGAKVFTLVRKATTDGRGVICCHNFSPDAQTIELPAGALQDFGAPLVDLIEGQATTLNGREIALSGYQVLWVGPRVNPRDGSA